MPFACVPGRRLSAVQVCRCDGASSMQCFHPVNGYKRKDGGFTSHTRGSAEAAPMVVRCWRCLGCRVYRREQWKVRCLHEASLHEASSFVTWTYDDAHLPPGGSVRMDDVSSALKRLRFAVYPLRIRFLAKTEYGPRTFRPHAHGLIFGLGFHSDRRAVRRTPAGELSYRSEVLSASWPHGVVECSDLTPRSVGYVANHNVDKLDGGKPEGFYDERVDPETGEVFQRERESVRMSNRPGIGRGWLEKFEGDVFPSGFIVLDGRKFPAPEYYKRQLKGRYKLKGAYRHERSVLADPMLGPGPAPFDDAAVMRDRAAELLLDDPEKAARLEANRTPERLEVREECLFLKTKRLKRESF